MTLESLSLIEVIGWAGSRLRPGVGQKGSALILNLTAWESESRSLPLHLKLFYFTNTSLALMTFSLSFSHIHSDLGRLLVEHMHLSVSRE